MADSTDAKTKAASPAASPSKPVEPPKPAAAAKPAPAPAKPVPAAAAPALTPASKPVATPAPAKPTPVVVATKAAPVVAKPAPKAIAAAAPKTKSTPVVAAPAPKPIEAVEKTQVKRGRKPKPKAIVPEPVVIVAKQKAAPIPAKAVTEGTKTMNETVMKAQETAKKFTSDASERTQALFGEMSSRAKTSYEKSVKLAEEMTEFSKGNVEALVESSKLAAKGAESLGQEAADYARKSFESSTAAIKTFASAKSPTELFKLQSDYMKSFFDTAVAESSKVTEAWLKLAGDVAQPLSNRYAVAVEKMKIAAA